MKQMWLVVEDDPIIRSILTALMTLWGVDYRVFKDGHEATRWLDGIEQGKPVGMLPDIVLMDIRMPGPQGTEIGKRMRQLTATQHIPIVIMTAYQLSRDERNQIMDMARPEHIIGKPLPSPEDLRTLLERTVQEAYIKRFTKQVTISVRQPQYRYLVDRNSSRRVAAMQVEKRRRSLSINRSQLPNMLSRSAD